MHFATADSADKSYAKHQFELFMDVISELEKEASNSEYDIVPTVRQ